MLICFPYFANDVLACWLTFPIANRNSSRLAKQQQHREEQYKLSNKKAAHDVQVVIVPVFWKERYEETEAVLQHAQCVCDRLEQELDVSDPHTCRHTHHGKLCMTENRHDKNARKEWNGGRH